MTTFSICHTGQGYIVTDAAALAERIDHKDYSHDARSVARRVTKQRSFIQIGKQQSCAAMTTAHNPP